MKRSTHKIAPVMLGTLAVGDQFIYDAATWEVLQQNPSKERDPKDGKARCKKINTPVIVSICRSNYVVKA